MRRYFNKLTLVILIFHIFCANTTRGQVVTGAAIIAAAGQISNQLANLGPQLGYAGSSIVGTTVTQLNQLTTDLVNKLGDKINTPIETLSIEIQNLARQITTTTNQLDEVLKRQRNCGVQDMEVLLATLNSIAMQLKEGIPFVDQSKPRFEFFRFDKHTFGTVPKSGGQVTLSGFNLWPDDKVKPVVQLWDESRSAMLATLAPMRGGNNNEISATIGLELIQPYAGKCLYIVVKPRERRGWWLWKETVEINEVHRPMCIPGIQALSLQLRSANQYTCPVVTRAESNGVGFYFENHDPVHSRQVSETKVLNLPEGCKIVETRNVREGITRFFQNASFSFTDKSITANAHLGDARDFNPPIGPRIVLEHAVWSYTVYPIIECTSKTLVTNKTTESAFVPFNNDAGRTQLSVLLPKNCDFSASNLMYEVWKKFGNEEPSMLLTSPWLQATHAGVSDQTTSDNARLVLSLRYNPGLAGGESQVFLDITAPACGY
jgi:hypothetical protein